MRYNGAVRSQNDKSFSYCKTRPFLKIGHHRRSRARTATLFRTTTSAQFSLR